MQFRTIQIRSCCVLALRWYMHIRSNRDQSEAMDVVEVVVLVVAAKAVWKVGSGTLVLGGANPGVLEKPVSRVLV